MQKIFRKILPLGVAVLLLFGALGLHGHASLAVTGAVADYYASVAGEEGTALLGGLHDLMTTTHTSYSTYADCRDKGPTTDPAEGGGVIEFYTHERIAEYVYSTNKPGTWNREHVWCKSLSNGLWTAVDNRDKGGGADLHHIRPSEISFNTLRSNNPYGEVQNGRAIYSKKEGGVQSELGGYLGGGKFEPLDNVKGDVARILMYVYTHYNTYENVYGTVNGSGDSSYYGTLRFKDIVQAGSEAEAISLLLKWNTSDPVDQIEQTRNEAVYKIQGNRNAFIDHPEYANKIWGNSGETSTTAPTSISIDPASAELVVGASYALKVVPVPSNGSTLVTWTTSDVEVATVSEGVVKAKAPGTATITATSKVVPSLQATAKITVTEADTDGTVTIDLMSFGTLDASYNFFDWEADGIKGFAFIYGGNVNSLQFNSNRNSYYLASSMPLPGAIRSVTVKGSAQASESNETEWRLLTSSAPYGKVGKKPTTGNDRGVKTVDAAGATWQVSGDDTYFALTYESSGAAYLESIVIEYDVGPEAVQAFRKAVKAIPQNGAPEPTFAAIRAAIEAYGALSEEEQAMVEEQLAVLRQAIDNYNVQARAYNKAAEETENAAKNAGNLIGG